MRIKVAAIPGKGRGVIAAEPFSRGDIIERVPMIVLAALDTKKISETLLDYYCFRWGPGRIAIACGYGSLYNHSAEPNVVCQRDFETNEMSFVAIRPIAAEEEITHNYNGDPEDKTQIIFDDKGGYRR